MNAKNNVVSFVDMSNKLRFNRTGILIERKKDWRVKVDGRGGRMLFKSEIDRGLVESVLIRRYPDSKIEVL